MLWNTVEDNPMLEADTILTSLNDSLTGDTDGRPEEVKEEVTDSPIEQ